MLVILGACSEGSDHPAPLPEIPKTEVAPVWEFASAAGKFASNIVAELIGDRRFTDARLVEFPNILMLLDAINSEGFTAAMNTLSSASAGHTWVLGVETMLPFEASGNYSDSSLLNLNEQQAKALLQANNSETNTLEPNSQPIIDMIVADNPDPFWMINLIDLYDQANYPDGRASELTGAEAIAQQFGATAAILNGPRFWVLDTIVSNAPPPAEPVTEFFGDIEMRLVASVLLPIDSLGGDIGGDAAYRVSEVSRDTVFSYVAGRQVYELHDPEGW